MKQFPLRVSVWFMSVLAGILLFGATSHADSREMPASYINKIAVPFRVTTYAQTEYQGYAITKAKKMRQNGEVVYRLRVDRDSKLNDSNFMYLYYDKAWQLYQEEEPAPKPENPEGEQERNKPPRKDKEDKNENEQNNEPTAMNEEPAPPQPAPELEPVVPPRENEPEPEPEDTEESEQEDEVPEQSDSESSQQTPANSSSNR